jgi:hypothetical protein
MNVLFEKLAVVKGPFDIIFDPGIGPMELQELGIASSLEYSPREQFAYGQGLDTSSLQLLIREVAENLGLREGETEVVDKLTDKVFKTQIEYVQINEGKGFWITIWYDAQMGHLHRQEKIEMFVKLHTEKSIEKYEFYEVKKNIWIQKIADDCKVNYQYGIEVEQLNEYIKNNDLLWFLEEILDFGYDLWDLLEEVNCRIEGSTDR